MKKREFLRSSFAAIAAGAAFGTVSRESAAQQACIQAGDPATFVLIHGAWCGGFVYDEVAARLRSRGHRVFAPSLTGLGDRTHLSRPDINLTTHVNDVLSLIRFYELRDIVLVGHSYGGMVISGVAQSATEDIASLVYLDAIVPELWTPPADAPPPPDDPSNTVPIDGEFAREIGIPMEDLWKYSPHPVGSFIEQFEFTGEHNSIEKKTFVWANQWPTFESAYDALSSDESWSTYSVAASHMLMLDAPDRVVEILEAAA
jgi:pimeloyl-ACP methyl ester carboxylesterase